MRRLLFSVCFAMLLASPSVAGPRFGIVAGLDATKFVDGAKALDLGEPKMHLAPEVGVFARWRLAHALEFETGAQLAEVGSRTEVTTDITTVYQPEGTGATLVGTIDDHVNVVELPLRLRLASPERSGWLLEAGIVPQYLTDAFVMIDVAQGLALAPRAASTRRRAQRTAVIFEQAGFEPLHTLANYRRWNFAGSVGVGRRFVSGPRVVDVTVRWDEGLSDMSEKYPFERRSRAFRLALSFS